MLSGGWRVVTLEFQLAADIEGATVFAHNRPPNRTGAIAFIRTFLNYFLNKELLEQRQILQALMEIKRLRRLNI
jgi:uncharacterized membrane protein